MFFKKPVPKLTPQQEAAVEIIKDDLYLDKSYNFTDIIDRNGMKSRIDKDNTLRAVPHSHSFILEIQEDRVVLAILESEYDEGWKVVQPVCTISVDGEIENL